MLQNNIQMETEVITDEIKEEISLSGSIRAYKLVSIPGVSGTAEEKAKFKK